MSVVSRIDRQVDLGALILIVMGVALYLVASSQLQEIAHYTFRNPGPPGALDAADRARYLSYGGLTSVALGCLVGAVAAGRHMFRWSAADH